MFFLKFRVGQHLQKRNMSGEFGRVQIIQETTEDAQLNIFPKVFADPKTCRPLMNAEVALMIQQTRTSRYAEADAGQRTDTFTDAATTMMDTVEQYCKQFGIVENPESVGVLRRFLDKSIQELKIPPFVAVSLANLALETVEEARTLFPALVQIDVPDQSLQHFLNEIRLHRTTMM